MNKKKVLLSVTATSMIAVTGAVLVINGGLNSSSAFATNGEVWHHYAAVAPSETTHGSKEFWASSTDGCATHTFTDPGPGITCIEHDFSKYDSFASLSRDDDRYVWCLNEQWGITPVVTENTLTYGLYPQTNVNDESLITELDDLTTPETNGYYFYKNAYYAKISATPYANNYVFDNGTAIVSGTTYWFKCKPISWTILTNDYVDADGNHLGYYLLSDVLLDAHRYNEEYDDIKDGHYANNYEYSEIRAWLNNDFYNSAFALGNSYIQTTTVDNSASTTNSSSNIFACNNTQDKAFLPSYQDYINPGYGFYHSENATNTRCCKTTDWARARGAYYDTNPSYLYNGHYWTRSPYNDRSYWAWHVYGDGTLYSRRSINLLIYSVRPGLSFKIA